MLGYRIGVCLIFLWWNIIGGVVIFSVVYLIYYGLSGYFVVKLIFIKWYEVYKDVV